MLTFDIGFVFSISVLTWREKERILSREVLIQVIPFSINIYIYLHMYRSNVVVVIRPQCRNVSVLLQLSLVKSDVDVYVHICLLVSYMYVRTRTCVYHKMRLGRVNYEKNSLHVWTYRRSLNAEIFTCCTIWRGGPHNSQNSLGRKNVFQ